MWVLQQKVQLQVNKLWVATKLYTLDKQLVRSKQGQYICSVYCESFNTNGEVMQCE